MTQSDGDGTFQGAGIDTSVQASRESGSGFWEPPKLLPGYRLVPRGTVPNLNWEPVHERDFTDADRKYLAREDERTARIQAEHARNQARAASASALLSRMLDAFASEIEALDGVTRHDFMTSWDAEENY